MKSKKGIAITAVILVAITIASFSVWLISDSPKMVIVVTDFESHLDGIDARHQIITNAIDTSLLKMIDGNLSPEKLISEAEISSSQINSQIIELVESDAPDEWQKSYLNYLESLRSSNSYIREIIIVANSQIEDLDNDEIDAMLKKIKNLQDESIKYAEFSLQSRP